MPRRTVATRRSASVFKANPKFSRKNTFRSFRFVYCAVLYYYAADVVNGWDSSVNSHRKIWKKQWDIDTVRIRRFHGDSSSSKTNIISGKEKDTMRQLREGSDDRLVVFCLHVIPSFKSTWSWDSRTYIDSEMLVTFRVMWIRFSPSTTTTTTTSTTSSITTLDVNHGYGPSLDGSFYLISGTVITITCVTMAQSTTRTNQRVVGVVRMKRDDNVRRVRAMFCSYVPSLFMILVMLIITIARDCDRLQDISSFRPFLLSSAVSSSFLPVDAFHFQSSPSKLRSGRAILRTEEYVRKEDKMFGYLVFNGSTIARSRLKALMAHTSTRRRHADEDEENSFDASITTSRDRRHTKSRRDVLVSSVVSMLMSSTAVSGADAAVFGRDGGIGGAMQSTGGASSGGSTGGLLQQFSGVYVVDAKDQAIVAAMASVADGPNRIMSPEQALLKLLPVKNPVFRTLEQNLESLSALRYPYGSPLMVTSNLSTTDDASMSSSSSSSLAKSPATIISSPTSSQTSAITTIAAITASDTKTWSKAERAVATAISLIDNKRQQFEPIFNPEDSTELSIQKAERGEILLGDIRQNLEQLKLAIERKNTTCTLEQQRQALLNLSFLGELLVKEYPYRVPSKGKYSFLPRLLGRTKVTFRFKRPSTGKVIGDVTLIADGYAAPITAGNFVDLCLRNFYTGLPIRETSKRVGLYQDPLSIPDVCVFGTFNEGFYDPLTGKLRKIPLEVIRLEGTPKLSYSSRRLPGDWGDFEDGDGTFESAAVSSRPILTFNIPGLIAFNHPSTDPNGGSSEFFGLQVQQQQSQEGVDSNSSKNKLNHLLDGLYAPFAFIIDGLAIFNSLKQDDVIESTVVDDFGALNLIKIRESSFKEMT